LLEAAAARGFSHVPTYVLDSILADMAEPVGSKARLSKVSRIIEFWKAQWGWSQVDVARALMQILPGAKPFSRGPAIPESIGREFIWNDLPSIAAALAAHRGCQTSAPAEPTEPPSQAEAIAAALDASSPGRPKPAKRASARFFYFISIPDQAPKDLNVPISAIPGGAPGAISRHRLVIGNGGFLQKSGTFSLMSGCSCGRLHSEMGRPPSSQSGSWKYWVTTSQIMKKGDHIVEILGDHIVCFVFPHCSHEDLGWVWTGLGWGEAGQASASAHGAG
jgi:hypothetical protein